MSDSEESYDHFACSGGSRREHVPETCDCVFEGCNCGADNIYDEVPEYDKKLADALYAAYTRLYGFTDENDPDYVDVPIEEQEAAMKRFIELTKEYEYMRYRALKADLEYKGIDIDASTEEEEEYEDEGDYEEGEYVSDGEWDTFEVESLHDDERYNDGDNLKSQFGNYVAKLTSFVKANSV